MKSDLVQALHEVGKMHHREFAAVNGNDPEWATWYAEKLVDFSEFDKFTVEQLARVLIEADKEYRQIKPSESWEEFYARKIASP
jgi:hypothetical protein